MMTGREISTERILVERSRFCTKGVLFSSEPFSGQLRYSFEHLGILSPVIVYEDESGAFHLIDGEKRIIYALERNTGAIRAEVLEVSTPAAEIIAYILHEKGEEISRSIINRIQFICFAMKRGVPESWIIEHLCIPLGFKPNSRFLEECVRINNLPSELRLFCHEKRYSLKQILNLTYYPPDILHQLISWRPLMQFSASVLDEIASNLKDYLRMQNKGIMEFVSEPEVQEIIHSSLSPRERTERLRDLLYRRRFPILSEVNSSIKNNIKSLNLPEGIGILWDRTLENREVVLKLHIKDLDEWKEYLRELGTDRIKDALSDILEKL